MWSNILKGTKVVLWLNIKLVEDSEDNVVAPKPKKKKKSDMDDTL